MRKLLHWFMCLIDALSGRSVVTAAPRHLRTGKRGEEDADLHLRELGYVVVARNWRSPRQKGEVDLIAWDDDVLCFVEVKTRTTRDVKPAEAAVDTKKQRELRLMAREYLRRLARRRNTRRWLRESNGAFARAGDQIPLYRFDVVSVYYDSPAGKVTDITLFKNAFRLS